MNFNADGYHYALRDAPKLKKSVGSITLNFYDGVRCPKLHFIGEIKPEQVKEISNRLRRIFQRASRECMEKTKKAEAEKVAAIPTK